MFQPFGLHGNRFFAVFDGMAMIAYKGMNITMISCILEGCQKLAGGRAKRHPRFQAVKWVHPGGMTELQIGFNYLIENMLRTFWHPFRVRRYNDRHPGVSLRLPPANIYHPSRMETGNVKQSPLGNTIHSTENSD